MIIGVAGRAQHGKDTIANYLEESYSFAKVGNADALRRLAEYINPIIRPDLGWGHQRYNELMDDVGYETAKKSAEFRRFLQKLGTGAREILGDNVWVDAAAMTAMQYDDVVISDVRFPNEAEWVLDNGGWLLRVIRPNFDNGVDPNVPSERYVNTLPAHETIINDGSEYDLTRKIDHLMTWHDRREFWGMHEHQA